MSRISIDLCDVDNNSSKLTLIKNQLVWDF